MDNIEFYSDKEIDEWLQYFEQDVEGTVITAPHIPFGYYAIRDEWLRRKFVREIEEGFKALKNKTDGKDGIH